MGRKYQEWQLLADDYIVAIERAGGVPVILPITREVETLMPLLQKLDGILFSGGSDIDPNLYGEYPKFGLGAIEPHRDAHEIRAGSDGFNEVKHYRYWAYVVGCNCLQ